jgi:hypothetical protein
VILLNHMKNIFQKKSLILSVILFIFSCFVFVFLYRNINNNKEASQLTQEKWQTEDTHRENAKSLADSIKAIEPEKALLETHFVQSSDVVPFLDTIEKLAKEIGTKAEVVSVNPTKDNSSLIVGIKASGNFGTIYKLITLLENSPYDLEFISADIQNSNGEDLSGSKNNKTKTPQWTATFQIKLLSFVIQ